MSLEHLQAIVWDLDGTLIDSAPDLAGALNTLLQKSALPVLEMAAIRTMIGNGVAKLVERGFKATGRALDDVQLQLLVPQFMAIYTKRATELTIPYPGTRTALQTFQDDGIRQAVCTNKPEAVSRSILQALELDSYFEIVVGGDTTAQKKPHILPMQTCLDALATTSSQCLSVGDSAVDVATAKAANMTVGIVTHGYTREPVETLGADFLIADLSTLPGDLYRRLAPEVTAV